VLDIGCGTGLCFPLLQERIGPEGRIVGVDPAPDMLGLAAARVADKGWRNVTLIEAAAEDAELPQADHALLCAVHDVLQSPRRWKTWLPTSARAGRSPRVAASGRRPGRWPST